eukprot:TRINITY_DN9069_c0_g1_i3.p1 TRINITY_DN9069_c0_g1~~TRINITY_DN9069_c0_g1_i3.p1  ORF type:complete len:521 (-),score=96.11 TRINITY_DN9069_c0_g1_i3:71-1633(-)
MCADYQIRYEEEEDYEEHILEESNEDDEFENVINAKIAEHKRTGYKETTKRPESRIQVRSASSGRNEHSPDYELSPDPEERLRQYEKKLREEEEQMINAQGEGERGEEEEEGGEDDVELVYEKFSMFVSAKKLSLEDFWTSEETLISPDEFLTFILAVDFRASNEELEAFINDLMDEEGKVNLQTLSKRIGPWAQAQDELLEKIRDKAWRIAKESQKKIASQSKERESQVLKAKRVRSSSSRPFSGYEPATTRPVSGFRPVSGVSTISAKSRHSQLSVGENLRTSDAGGDKGYYPSINKSKVYIKKNRAKRNEVEKEIALTLAQTKNEREYDCIIKIGEANEMLVKMHSTLMFKLHKADDHYVMVGVYDTDILRKELTISEFVREYNILKSQYKQSLPGNIWDSLNEVKKSAKFQNVVKMTDEEIERELKMKNAGKKQRQSQLKEALLETMNLVKSIREQIISLQKRGINSQIQLSAKAWNSRNNISTSNIQATFHVVQKFYPQTSLFRLCTVLMMSRLR